MDGGDGESGFFEAGNTRADRAERQDPEDDVLLPPQDFSSIVPDPSIGIVLFSFQMRVNYKQLAKGSSSSSAVSLGLNRPSN